MKEAYQQRVMEEAMRLLSQCRLSTKELEQKLSKKFFNYTHCDKLIAKAITRLKELHLLNDHQTAESIARRHEMKGDRLIRQKLERSGIDPLYAAQVIAELGDENIRAHEVALKKWPSIKNEEAQKRQQKLLRFLSSRGFAAETCYEIARKFS